MGYVSKRWVLNTQRFQHPNRAIHHERRIAWNREASAEQVLVELVQLARLEAQVAVEYLETGTKYS